jgi:pyridoxal phosphate enzyme (YggS family)
MLVTMNFVCKRFGIENNREFLNMSHPQVIKNIERIENQLNAFGTELLPVSKTFGPELILEAFEAGKRKFGENKVQELLPKYEALPKEIEWHLIGHLQTNKVKYIAPFISLIQSVDSEKLLAEIDKQAARAGRIIPCLLQVFIAGEETKFGWDAAELQSFYQNQGLKKYPNVWIKGLMGMASFSEDESLVRSEFRGLKKLFEDLKAYNEEGKSEMKILSMGMSGDYLWAAEEGSTMVRMGSAVFGNRSYS